MNLDQIRARIVPAENGCMEWTGARQSVGYGNVFFEGRNWLVHRLIYTVDVDPIPEGMTIDHLCRNRICANTDHFEVVTQVVNLLRGESLSAQRARQTHCFRGHSLEDALTWTNSNGRPRRRCRTCHNANQRRKAAAS